MSRVKRGVTAHAKHKKVYKAAKGYYGRRKNTIRAAKPAVEKAGQYAFRDRKRKKRTLRALWIQRLNAAVRPFGMTYCRISPSTSRPRSRQSPRRPRRRSPPEAYARLQRSSWPGVSRPSTSPSQMP
jgi:large subunit ribosomal protein L20